MCIAAILGVPQFGLLFVISRLRGIEFILSLTADGFVAIPVSGGNESGEVRSWQLRLTIDYQIDDNCVIAQLLMRHVN